MSDIQTEVSIKIPSVDKTKNNPQGIFRHSDRVSAMDARAKLAAAENRIKINNAIRQLEQRESSQPGTPRPQVFVDAQGQEHSTVDRVVKSVPPPITTVPTDEELFSLPAGKPDYRLIMEHYRHQGKLSQSQVLTIITMVTKVFQEEPNVLQVSSPVTVCGDVHGQFYDLLKLFEIAGDPKDVSFLFLGDYVDRGYYSLEVLITLYAMKINFPKTFAMLRGNHESAQMTSHFTFKSECLRKYSRQVYNECLRSFSALPIVAIMNKQFFCVHGGISKDIVHISDIDKINRFQIDFPARGAYCDLMWSDPSSEYDQYKTVKKKEFEENYERGCSYMYSYKAVTKFLQKNNLLCMIRAHQAQDKGYRMYAPTHQSFPSVISLFSAPNYCGTYGNKAAILKYDVTTMNIRQFSSQPEPYHLPNEMNVFTWSVPFVAERVCEILLSILNICSDDELGGETELSRELFKSVQNMDQLKLNRRRSSSEIESISEEEELEEAISVESSAVTTEVQEDETLPDGMRRFDRTNKFDRDSLRKKVLAIGRISRMFQLLRDEAEKVEELRNLTGGLTLPKGVLLDGADELDRQLSHFERVRRADLCNEGVPPTLKQQKLNQEREYEHLKEEADESMGL